MAEENLNSKPLWRFLKVVYILAWLFGFLVIGMSTWFARPYKSESFSKLGFTCASNNQSWEFEPNGTFYDLQNTRLEQSDITNIKKTCAYGADWYQNEASRLAPVPDQKYSLHNVYNSYGSWGGLALAFGISSIGVFVVIETVKSIVLYIAGISVWRGMLLYGLLLLAEMFKNDKKTE